MRYNYKSSGFSRRSFLKTFTAAAVAAAADYSLGSGVHSVIANSIAANEGQTPNIVFILADDLGYSSINCFGADKELVRTPHIDKLAESGIRFTNAYTPASICSPTRYGFVTGRYPWRSSMKFGVVDPGAPLLPDPSRVTIADWLKNRGYETAAIGKWHLGYGSSENGEFVDFTGKLSPGPLDLGFDYHFGVPQNHGDMYGVYVENDGIYGLRSRERHPYSKTFYGSQYRGYDAPQRVNKDVMGDLTDKAVEWLRVRSEDKPFFLYFNPVAVHHPITPSDYMRGVSDCGPYGDFIQDVDLSVGRLVEALEYMNLKENTIIIFTSDNGGDIPGDPSKPERYAQSCGLEINGKLKGDKHTIWEGGCKVPFIFSWDKINRKGALSNDMISLIDVFATVCEITDGKLPESEDTAPDSFSFLSSLKGPAAGSSRKAMVISDVHGRQALIAGGWKYIDDTLPEGLAKARSGVVKSFKKELYNLKDDPSESRNICDKHPDIAEKMFSRLEKIRSVNSSRTVN
ncbi:Arylsulfatase [Limihaloglobus sulfuriphilus]|uniref:Arylsulfatase n=1 Tax=Limihaloglobus sulfuriphilus TaxID=1851148 RepID=A0A1Q2MBZ1_9BACT|nr:arylsulfatase [Limihaloglobus sulfuriphilus]AQQ70233.1 Arylsulfatase [Limihaloglobus sulfuriphilus]